MLNTIYTVFAGRNLLLILCCACSGLLTCKQSGGENEILKLVYIEGIHDDARIVTADSLFLSGKLREAAELFSIPRSETSKQLYCQARLAEMDYYLRELYGKNHENYALPLVSLLPPDDAIDSFLYSIHFAYEEEDLDTNFVENWRNASLKLGEDQYLINKGNSILGENYYTFCFNQDSSDFYLAKSLQWFDKKNIKIYDGYWIKIRLTSTGTYFRDHVSSVAQINELLVEEKWKPILDSVHISLAHSNRAYILFRFYQYKEAFEDNLNAIALAEKTLAAPVFQEALKSQLMVTTFWKKDSLWDYYHDMLASHIKQTQIDYCNYNRLVGRYFYEKNQLDKSLPYHAKAIQYCLTDKHINRPLVSNLAYMHSEELEKEGFFQEAITTYLIADNMWYNKNWDIKYLMDSSYLNKRYGYVPLARFGHIYFSWYLADLNQYNLDQAEQFANLAHQYYYRHVETLEENSLLTFASERQNILELYCLIYGEKYLKHRNSADLARFYKFSEENRGAIFSLDMKAMWEHYPLPTEWLIEGQKLKAENKLLLNQYPINQEKIVANNLAIQKNEIRMKTEYPEFFQKVLNQEAPNIESLQDSLANQQKSILSLDIIGHTLYVLCLSSFGKELQKLDLSEEHLQQINTLINVMSSDTDYSPENYSVLANSVWNWLIPDKIKNDRNDKWLIIPDGILHRLNFEALVTSAERVNSYQEMPFLLHEKMIQYSPSIRLYFRSKVRNVQADIAVGMAWTDEASIEIYTDTILPEIPGSFKEMVALKEGIKNNQIFTGNKSTKKVFLTEYSNPKVSLMHLALHGLASSENPDDIKLYFRSKNWTVDSMFGYDLLPFFSNIQTIILSSCETAKGVDLAGEGNYSLARYFLINGAHNVMASLWLIDDLASSLIFSHFYKNYLQSDDGNLTLAKRNIIKTGPAKMSKPYYWASLIEYN